MQKLMRHSIINHVKQALAKCSELLLTNPSLPKTRCKIEAVSVCMCVCVKERERVRERERMEWDRRYVCGADREREI